MVRSRRGPDGVLTPPDVLDLKRLVDFSRKLAYETSWWVWTRSCRILHLNEIWSPEASCETTKLGFFDISVVFPIVTDVYGELGIRTFGAAEPFTMPYYFVFLNWHLTAGSMSRLADVSTISDYYGTPRMFDLSSRYKWFSIVRGFCMTSSGLMSSSCRLSEKYKGRTKREIVGCSAAPRSHLRIAPEAPN